MVPKKVGAEMRSQRLKLRLRQIDIAREVGVTRAYVSAVERGVDWDPDSDKLVVWANALGLSDDHWLTRLPPRWGRHFELPPEVLAVIREAAAHAFVELVRERPDELVALLTKAWPDQSSTPPDNGVDRRAPSPRGDPVVNSLARIVRAVEAQQSKRVVESD